MQPILAVNHLAKSFDGKPAVRDVSFTVHAGEIFGLLGPNGAGKTTTIQMILDVLTPDAGDIRVFDLPLHEHRQAIMSRMNFSSSYISLPGNLQVEESLAVFARLYGVRSAQQRVEELLILLDLAALRSKLVGTLSSGQLTRLYLAKALINNPELLLLDEPTASLDPDVADRMRSLLRRLAAEQRTAMLYTSHNMAEVEQLCHRVGFLHHGRILAMGTPEEVITTFGRANLEEVFLHVARAPEGTFSHDA